MNVVRGVSGVPRRLSNKRRRHITVTHTLLGGPGVVVTSRPAKGLSPRATDGVIKLLGSVAGRNATMIVAARGVPVLSGFPNVMCHYGSNLLRSIAGRCGRVSLARSNRRGWAKGVRRGGGGGWALVWCCSCRNGRVQECFYELAETCRKDDLFNCEVE